MLEAVDEAPSPMDVSTQRHDLRFTITHKKNTGLFESDKLAASCAYIHPLPCRNPRHSKRTSDAEAVTKLTSTRTRSKGLKYADNDMG